MNAVSHSRLNGTLSQHCVNQHLQIHSPFQFYYVTFSFSFIIATQCMHLHCLPFFLPMLVCILWCLFSVCFVTTENGLCILYTTGFHLHSYLAEGNHGLPGIAILMGKGSLGVGGSALWRVWWWWWACMLFCEGRPWRCLSSDRFISYSTKN